MSIEYKWNNKVYTRGGLNGTAYKYLPYDVIKDYLHNNQNIKISTIKSIFNNKVFETPPIRDETEYNKHINNRLNEDNKASAKKRLFEPVKYQNQNLYISNQWSSDDSNNSIPFFIEIAKKLGYQIDVIDIDTKAHWIASSDLSFYDSISEFQKSSEIDWDNMSNNNIEVDDIVYIYVIKPLQRIAIKTQVTKAGYGKDELLENISQFNNDDSNNICEHFIRLKLICFIDSDFLGIKDLHKHGINGNIQGKRRVVGQALAYIQSHEGDKPSKERLDKEFEKELIKSKKSTAEERKERLDKATKIPQQIEIISKGFKRNADVVITVLERANGFCERCKLKAPFKKKKDQTPYLEVHHKKQLSDGGEDSVENAIAICPNCHRELHFGNCASNFE